MIVVGVLAGLLIWAVASRPPGLGAASKSRLLVGADEPIRLLRVSDDGSRIAAASPARLIVYAPGVVRSIPMDPDRDGSPLAIGWLPGGSTLAFCDRPGGPVWLWSVGDVEPASAIEGVRGDRLAFLPDGRLAVASEDRTLSVVDPGGGMPGEHLDLVGEAANLLACSPDGRYLAFATWPDETSGAIGLWDRQAGEVRMHPEAHRISVTAMAFSEDGSALISAGSDRRVRRWEVGAMDAPRLDLEREHSVYSLAALPGRDAFAMGDSSGAITIVDASTFRTRASVLEHGSTVTGLQAHRDGRSLVSASLDHTVRLWDLDTIVQ